MAAKKLLFQFTALIYLLQIATLVTYFVHFYIVFALLLYAQQLSGLKEIMTAFKMFNYFC